MTDAMNGETSGLLMSTAARALRSKHARELRDTWQARVLAHAKGMTFAVVCAVLAHSWFEVMDVLLRVVFPGFARLELPMLSGPAKIVSTGQVVCDLINERGHLIRNVQIYDKEADLIKEFRDMADQLKLNDQDRINLFISVQRWIVADHRVKPSQENAA